MVTNFLSCEYIHKDMSYWWMSGSDINGMKFLEIPLLFLDNKRLKASQIYKEDDYSSIEIRKYRNYSGKKYFIYYTASIKYSQDEESIGITNEGTEFNPKLFLTLNWNQFAHFALKEKFPVDNLCGLYHHQVIKTNKKNKIQINDVYYKVTAFLPDTFAIFGSDYKIETNPNWITFDIKDENHYREILKQFDIVELHINGKIYKV